MASRMVLLPSEPPAPLDDLAMPAVASWECLEICVDPLHRGLGCLDSLFKSLGCPGDVPLEEFLLRCLCSLQVFLGSRALGLMSIEIRVDFQHPPRGLFRLWLDAGE